MKNQNNHVKLYKFPANLRIPAMRHHVIDQVSFQLLVKQITKKINSEIKFQSLSLGILQVRKRNTDLLFYHIIYLYVSEQF
jgi:hypothetical protein